jgi:murein DD-endopeptidase MepM/ murein hydrolase activator NlpD
VYSKSALRFLSTCGLCVLLTGCGTDIIRVSDKSPIPNPFAGSARFDPPTTGSLSAKSEAASDANGNGDVIAAPSASIDGGSISSAPINAPAGAAAPGKVQQQSALKPLATTVISSTTDPKQPKKVASLSADQSSTLTVPQNSKAVAASSGNGKWVAQGGTEVALADGEIIATLSSRYGVPEAAIRGVNGLSAKAKLSRGTKVIIPVFVADGAVANVKTKTDAAKAPAIVAAAPALTPLSNAKGSKKDDPSKTAQASAPQTSTQVASLEPTDAASSNAAAPSADTSKAVASAGFRWPARGRIIQAFGDKNGVKSTGINISLPQGTPVKAAEAGVVAYAGSEVKGFGNLIMIRHPDGWVSVYGNTSEIKVKRGDEIKRGQIIALSGQSGDVSAPQLHFELRKGSVPVDPVEHLSDD